MIVDGAAAAGRDDPVRRGGVAQVPSTRGACRIVARGRNVGGALQRQRRRGRRRRRSDMKSRSAASFGSAGVPLICGWSALMRPITDSQLERATSGRPHATV